MIGIATPDELGHMQRQGPHPLGISGDVNRGHDRPQVPSHRGVQCQQHKRSFLRGRQLSPRSMSPDRVSAVTRMAR